MIILGLTGSIGMGKSTAARVFRRCGVPVHDADRVVHGLMGPGGAAVAAVEAAFPGVTKSGAVDRQALGRRVFGDAQALRRLEAILHPLVKRDRGRFLRHAARRQAALVVLDVPLLFETGGEHDCDATVVISAPPFVQAQRVLKRPGMNAEKLQAVLSQQMPDGEKRRRADFVVHTGLGKGYSLKEVEKIIKVMATWPARHWPPSGCRRRYAPVRVLIGPGGRRGKDKKGPDHA